MFQVAPIEIISKNTNNNNNNSKKIGVAYRQPVRDPVTGVHGAKTAAPQHRTHLVDLVKRLLLDLHCGSKKHGKVGLILHKRDIKAEAQIRCDPPECP